MTKFFTLVVGDFTENNVHDFVINVALSGQSNAQYFDGSEWISFNNLDHELLESCASFYANDDTKAIVTGGIDFEGVLFDKVWIFDFLERTYSLTTQKLPKAIAGHSCTSVQLYNHDMVSTRIIFNCFFFSFFH